MAWIQNYVNFVFRDWIYDKWFEIAGFSFTIYL